MGNIDQPQICTCQLDPENIQHQFGLYYHKDCLPDKYKAQNVKLPIEKIDYDIQITDNIAKTTISQTYLNLNSNPISTQYIFPVSPDACFHSFEAEINNGQKVKGIVKEKQQAKQEFQEQKDRGNTVALQEISEDSPDIMKVELANIQGNSTVKIEIQFIEELTVCMNKFYGFKLKQKMTPRYCNVKKLDQKTDEFAQKIPNMHTACIQNLKVNIKASDKIEMLTIPSHQVDLLQKENVATITAMNINFDKDFDLYYATQHINKPHIVLSQNEIDKQICAQVTFLPNFQTGNLDDALAQYLQDSSVSEFDINSAPAEFLFILDRSGSMHGERIEQAKKALQIFLQSLPQNSKFNIYSYGSKFDSMFKESVPYDEQHLNMARNELNKFRSDYGGTKVYPPMKAALESEQDKNLAKIVFLLTDGDISQPKEIIQLVKKKIKTTRLHTIGIGSGCSSYLVKELAIEGKGESLFIQDDEDMTEKIMKLLHKSLSPTLANISLQYDKNLIESITPNPEKMPIIFANTPFMVNIFFKSNISLADISNSQISLRYFDSTIQQTLKQTLQIDNNSYLSQENYPFKLGIFKQIKALERAIENPEYEQDFLTKFHKNLDDIYFAKQISIKEEIQTLSIKHQILSTQTAFICIIQELPDEQQQQNKQQREIEVQIQRRPDKKIQNEEEEVEIMSSFFCGKGFSVQSTQKQDSVFSSSFMNKKATMSSLGYGSFRQFDQTSYSESMGGMKQDSGKKKHMFWKDVNESEDKMQE